jgi:hypothetical protein
LTTRPAVGGNYKIAKNRCNEQSFQTSDPATASVRPERCWVTSHWRCGPSSVGCSADSRFRRSVPDASRRRSAAVRCPRGLLLDAAGLSRPQSYGDERRQWEQISHLWYQGAPRVPQEQIFSATPLARRRDALPSAGHFGELEAGTADDSRLPAGMRLGDPEAWMVRVGGPSRLARLRRSARTARYGRDVRCHCPMAFLST